MYTIQYTVHLSRSRLLCELLTKSLCFTLYPRIHSISLCPILYLLYYTARIPVDYTGLYTAGLQARASAVCANRVKGNNIYIITGRGVYICTRCAK